MKIFSINNRISELRTEIWLINIIILTYIYRSTIPSLKFPFLVLYSLFIVYSVVYYRKRFLPALQEFIKNQFLMLLLALILLLSFLNTDKIYLSVFKDVANALVLISIFFFLPIIVSDKKSLNSYVSNLVYLIVVFAIGISLFRLLDLIGIYSYSTYSIPVEGAGKPTDVKVPIDSNFALLPIFNGIFGLFYFMEKRRSKIKYVFYILLLVFFSLNIVFAGSRRGIISFSILIIFLAAINLFRPLRNHYLLKHLVFNGRIFLVVFFSIILIVYLFFFHTSNRFKDYTLSVVGSKNHSEVKSQITLNIYKIISSYKTISYYELYDKMWTSGTYPEDPDSGWGSRIHHTIFPLTGKNVEIVPSNAKGYLMDSTCNGSYYSNNNMCEAYTLLVQLNSKQDDHYKASVFCYVSDSADIDVACLTVGHGQLSNIISGKGTSEYDLYRKGAWQKLEIEFVSEDGLIPLFLTFWKKGVNDFSHLNGYVIFAYPVHEKLENVSYASNISYMNSKTLKLQGFMGDSLNDLKNGHKSKKGTLKLVNILEDKESNTTLIQKHNKLKFLLLNNINNSHISHSSLLPMPIYFSAGFLQDDPDPIRNWASRFISEDTTYYPYKQHITVDSLNNSFIGSRTFRWEFALKLFKYEFNLKQKLFGGGFSFLNWYGYYFNKDKTKIDYPHNPFLSILLYSGLFGLIVYLVFIIKVFYYYAKYFAEYKILVLFFSITFFFSFFSAGNPFDPPIMGFFALLPFFIHMVNSKSEN